MLEIKEDLIVKKLLYFLNAWLSLLTQIKSVKLFFFLHRGIRNKKLVELLGMGDFSLFLSKRHKVQQQAGEAYSVPSPMY